MQFSKFPLFNQFILVVFLLFMSGCSGKSLLTSALEGGASYLENPSMELVLDRMNTAAAAAELSSYRIFQG